MSLIVSIFMVHFMSIVSAMTIVFHISPVVVMSVSVCVVVMAYVVRRGIVCACV